MSMYYTSHFLKIFRENVNFHYEVALHILIQNVIIIRTYYAGVLVAVNHK